MYALRRISRFLIPYWRIGAITVVLVIIPAGAELTVPRLLQYVIDKGITPGDLSVIIRGALLMLAAAVVSASTTIGQAIFRARLSQGMAYDLRNAVYNRIQSFSFGNLDQMQTGQLITRLTSDVNMVRMFFGMGLALIIRALFTLIGSLIFLIATDWRLSLMMLVLIPSVAVIFWLFTRRASPLFNRVQQKLAALNTAAQENLAGILVVKAFVREPFESQKFASRNEDYVDENIRVGRLMALAFPAIQLLTNVGTLAVVGLGGAQTIRGVLTVGQLVAFNNYLMTTMIPMLMLAMLVTMLSRADASASRLVEVLDTKSLVTNPSEPLRPERVVGRVEFKNVTFRYDGSSDEDVLKDIDLTVPAGQTVAILGATGSGKSTLVNLIPRFYDVTAGSVLVDGIDVRDYELDRLRSHVGVVLQQTTLFAGTIRDNIAYGAGHASMEQIVAAAEIAQAHEFISRMPDGYDSLVEARGTNLSGGQKQRLAIARALLIAPAILILDDATSAVDMDTEYKIQQALEGSSRNLTTFVIAQRISSVLHADKIIVLDRGRIVAQGSHQELIQTSPIYREIYCSQLNEGAQRQTDER